MKKLFIILIGLLPIISCKTTKLDATTGDRNPTSNTKHMRKIHPYGFWAAGKYIEYDYPKKVAVRK